MEWLKRLLLGRRKIATTVVEPASDMAPAAPSVVESPAKQTRKRRARPPANIGYLDARCASCHGELPKKPGRKAKCPLCGEFNFIRTRPSDNKQVVVNAQQVRLVEEQWARKNGTIRQFLASRRREDEHREMLTQRFGKAPLESDVKWSMLNDDLLSYAQKGEWGMLTGVHIQMCSILASEKRWKDAASHLFVVCYDDLRQGFSMTESNLGRLSLYLERAGALDEAAAKDIFEHLAGRVQRPRSQLNARQAWPTIWKALRSL